MACSRFLLKALWIMVFLLPVALLFAILPFNLLQFCAAHSSHMHRICIDSLPPSPHRDFYASILCGQHSSIFSPGGVEMNALLQVGLIHLAAVSAHHLRLLEWGVQSFESLIWRRIQGQPISLASASWLGALMRILVFSLWVGAAGCAPYLVRAWLDLLLREISRELRLAWRPTPRVSISGFVSLSLCRSSADALLLLIGWTAAIAFALGASIQQCQWQENLDSATPRARVPNFDIHRKKLARFCVRQIQSCALLYLFLLPLFWHRNWPSALIILSNAALAPLLSPVLLPISLLFRCLASTRAAADLVIGMILSAVTWLANWIPPPEPLITQALPFQTATSRWIYVALLSICAVWIDQVLHHPPSLKGNSR